MTLEFLSLNPAYIAPSSWWQHVPVAHWLVSTIKPKVIVELGSHYGVSFFAFCEAAEKLSPGTFVYAVDTWEGDEHAGFYPENVYTKVSEYWAKHHKARGRLVRSTFDKAATHFEDNSIDILHIDGLHSYDAVKHDFETWLPKLKNESIVLFHDINVRERDFGVWRLWQELRDDPEHLAISILNGHGLGILAFGTNTKESLCGFESILPLLIAKGELVERLVELTPGGSFVMTSYEVEAHQARAQAEQSRAEAEQARAEAEQARAEAEQARAEAEQANKMLHDILGSRIWRVSSPIRRVLGKLKS